MTTSLSTASHRLSLRKGQNLERIAGDSVMISMRRSVREGHSEAPCDDPETSAASAPQRSFNLDDSQPRR
jgi:hypothetical protein